jgi:hypothetical protein
MKDRPSLNFQLTPEQQAQIQQLSGKSSTTVELKPEALEQRVAPGVRFN